MSELDPLSFFLPLYLLPSLGVCGCCGALRPRYKRLVDNIFPEDPEVRSSSNTCLFVYLCLLFDYVYLSNAFGMLLLR